MVVCIGMSTYVLLSVNGNLTFTTYNKKRNAQILCDLWVKKYFPNILYLLKPK